MTSSKLSRSEQRLHDHAQLLNTIADHMETDPGSVPCLQSDQWRDWTSSDYPSLKRAAAACQTCPALEACKQYADQWETRGAGCWAGRIRGRPEPAQPDPPTQPSTQTVITLKGI